MEVQLSWSEFVRMIADAVAANPSPALMRVSEAPPQPQHWWVAPAVTGAAVLVAIATAARGSYLQSSAIADNRRLRVVDDVREVLAEALRDIARVPTALDRAEAAALRRSLGRSLWRVLNDDISTPNQRQRAGEHFDALRAELADLQKQHHEAMAASALQAERLELLVGPDHELTRLLAPLQDLESAYSEAWTISGDGSTATDAKLRSKIADARESIEALLASFREQARAYIVEQHQPEQRWDQSRRCPGCVRIGPDGKGGRALLDCDLLSVRICVARFRSWLSPHSREIG